MDDLNMIIIGSAVGAVIARRVAGIYDDPDLSTSQKEDALRVNVGDIAEEASAAWAAALYATVAASPEAREARAAKADEARKAAAVAAKAETDRVLRQIERTAARDALSVAKADLEVAKRESEHAEKADSSSDRDRMLLRGAVVYAESRVADAEAALAKVSP